MTTKRICLWSGPRNISTALMYSFAQRADTTVYDEPLYAHYLANSPAKAYHPDADKIIDSMESDAHKVIEQIILGPQPTPVVFFKHMTHHLIKIDKQFLEKTINVFLTRDPQEMLPSYAHVVETPNLSDVGYAMHIELLAELRALGQEPIILDARQILLNPKGVLTQLCQQIGIPFDPEMLHWTAGPRVEDGIWAEHWYTNVHRSEGFSAYRPKLEAFPAHLEPLLKECQPLYEELSAMAIEAE